MKDDGRVNRLSSATEPVGGLGPTGFDPAREPLALVESMLEHLRDSENDLRATVVLSSGLAIGSVADGYVSDDGEGDVLTLNHQPGSPFFDTDVLVTDVVAIRWTSTILKDCDSDGPRMAETTSARGEAGPARAAEGGIAKEPQP